jgi:pimeloyl-ACP methyl ester carboxylesterase
MKERGVTFGPAEAMVGVLAEPDTAPTKPHVLLLNAGFVHRVGPGRLSVEIARQVALAGFPSLRFDFSGIGDSPARVPPLDPIACGLADARAAMDHLCAEHGARKFILLGLCSGARHAHHVAVADPRVVGGVMLDGYAYPTTRASLLAMAERLAHPRALLAGAKRRLLGRPNAGPSPSPPPEEEGDAFFPGDPTRDQMAKDLRALSQRRVQLLYIYTGEWRAYRYAGQLRDAFRDVPLGPVLSERMIDTADHLYFTRPERVAMLGMVKQWLHERFS